MVRNAKNKVGEKFAFAQRIVFYNGRIQAPRGELATLFGVTQTMVGYWETGTNLPSSQSLKKILLVYYKQKVFTKGEEVNEAKALWQLWLAARYAKADDRPKEHFDEDWFRQELLKRDTSSITNSNNEQLVVVVGEGVQPYLSDATTVEQLEVQEEQGSEQVGNALPMVESEQVDSQKPPETQRTSEHYHKPEYQLTRRTVLVGLTSFVAGTIIGGGLVWKMHSGGSGLTRASWNSTGTMQLGRSSFRATTLHNGMVLVEGGVTVESGYTNESERFDSHKGIWSKTRGLMNEKRAEHTATLLPDGRVLVIGGFAIDVKDSAEWYDPSTDTWTLARHTMSVPRTRHTATLLYDGRVLVAGGLNNAPHKTVELYDIERDSWVPAASMHSPHIDHVAVRLFDGRVLVIGGTTANDGHSCTNKVEIYDPRTNTWTAAPDMMLARAYFTATILPDGRVLIIGGRLPSFDSTPTTEIYNPYTNTWSSGAAMHYGRQNPRGDDALLLEDGTVLIVGGDTTGTSEVYIPTKDIWTSPLHLHNTHYVCSTALLSEGRVLVAGGLDTFTSESGSTHQTPSTEIYTL